ncbi:NADP-dependent malic enzyme [Tenacibaculum finnmarkense]|uniref:NADP-dependent malic enzyme n=1 Tax=Tenacibaculum finnmarkense genomovar ulcerans TaxID=2781388 RepID=A0A2I2LD57_9FLAO|nr:NADP-dependent malic enzyme [Tenacibaculum finnmarkense]ALU73919.1 malic enzyme [Tenacibaculum dicentrarchi]MBE7633681.1 NADP-dependent malic enzyme [Tenacibaculum finnmarkense genomovar ulcerans]MBE7645332.1 NADP-dependent malic enzyme [Tenacibaculum finnmarkense genomovar ulcerans]MBE7647470.1 NADP-dependent malic enzyme [Tenacibaculum finnmarkense genomovar ulcerans]MBE7687251.1 NADP-dependent malic enzyme [Tenacibaculum finnmarkense genomovar ulcerans]
MSDSRKRREALLYHAKPKPGKIAVVPTKKYATQHDLALAYSPGVAEPCLEIAKDKNNVYKYTAKGNLVAVISNGTAVLGLGDIGPEASKPVMEGKGLLFKIFADIDVFDIEVDTTDVDKFVETVKAIAPTFGGINLEDIKAPEAFEIERRLIEELDIPVMHDDQHGTAIISAAALKNAIEIIDKNIANIKIIVNGAGAAAISCTRLYLALGAKRENIVMCDSKGVIRKDRDNLTSQKAEFATDKDLNTLEEAMHNADVFIGLSKGNVVTPAMLLAMAKDPIVFAMANPDPEIEYQTAIDTRDDIIMATGRSDHPNQVNNVLGFPFIFRGALDVRATKINEEMKMAAVHALADLAKKSVPEQVNIVYDEVSLSFGREYIIPKPFDPRLIYEIPPAIAKAAMESGVAQEPITDWKAYREQLMDRSGNGNKEIRLLHNRAKKNPKRVVFAEADHIDVLKAAQRVSDEKIAIPILLGRKEVILELKEELGFNAEVTIIDPKTDEESARRNRYAEFFWKTRQRKGITFLEAQKWMRERNYFAAMMVNTGEADALITGYSRSYASVVKPMLELIEKDKGVTRVAATNMMLTKQGPIFLADTTININPTAKDLAKITQLTSVLAKMFGMTPHIAMLGFSNFGSSKSESSVKIREAVAYIHRNHPNVIVDGELQADFALNPELLAKEFPFSKLNGKRANILIFPNLESANITYKLMKEAEGVESIGPILLGMSKPVHILQLGASVDEMVNMAAVAVVDAQNKERIAKV